MKQEVTTRSQAVVRVAFGTKPLSLTVSEICNVEYNAMVDMTLIRPLNKNRGHSFWYTIRFLIDDFL